MTPLLGLDYAGGRPDPDAIRSAGYAFVVRYLSSGGPGLPGKLLTPDEAARLRAAGVDIVSNWETTADRMLAGWEAGEADATQAVAQVLACGGRPDRPIYFSADWDAAETEQDMIDAYLRGAASVIGAPNVGIYGGFWPVSRALDNGTARWAWQTDAWSGGNRDPRINLHQRITQVTVGGVACDVNEAMTADYGQWSADGREGGPGMQMSETVVDAYGNPVSVGDLLKWISFHVDLVTDALGGPGSRNGLPPEQEMAGHPSLGGRTVVEALAVIGAKLGIEGFDAETQQKE